MKNYISKQQVKIFFVGKKIQSMECYSYTVNYEWYGTSKTDISVKFDQDAYIWIKYFCSILWKSWNTKASRWKKWSLNNCMRIPRQQIV